MKLKIVKCKSKEKGTDYWKLVRVYGCALEKIISLDTDVIAAISDVSLERLGNMEDDEIIDIEC